MAFKRALAPVRDPDVNTLTQDMAGIGMNIGAYPNYSAKIEDTLLFASEEGMERADLRVLAILVTWLGVHSARVNLDRLTKLVTASGSTRVRAFWGAIGRWLVRDRRFARLSMFRCGSRVDLLEVGTEFQARRHGEDPRFEGTLLRVPANVLRDRAADILTPAQLAQRHSVYRWRLVIGPTYRADMWAALEKEPAIKASELARHAYGSFATAWQVKREFTIWKEGMS